MKINSIGSKFTYLSKYSCPKKSSIQSAPKIQSADFLTFKGKFEDMARVIPSVQQTDLEKKIMQNSGLKTVPTVVKKFANGETYVNIKEDVRGKDVYIMPVKGENVNDNLMETYLKADAAKRAGANKVIAIMPSFDYARQEKKTETGEPIAARLNMDLLKTSGVDEVITTDLHTPALEGFASNAMKITHLEALSVMKDYIKSKNIDDVVVVSPDLGGAKRVDKLAKALDCEKAIIYKHRQAHNQAVAEDLIGEVEGKNCVIYDDMIDTAGTISEAAGLLKKNGAKDIYVCATHGFLNGIAGQRLDEAPIKEVIVTNSVPKKSNSTQKLKQLDISIQIAEAMRKISS